MPIRSFLRFLCLLFLGLAACAEPETTEPITVPLWQKATLDFGGPASAERGAINPFTDYRLDVTFTHADTTLTIPGFYAADGDAAQTSADSGAVWQVRFRPPLTGEWTYRADFRRGAGIAYADDPAAGEPVALTHATGRLRVTEPAPGERGRLLRTHPRYLRWAATGDYFLKGGADSPENLLGFVDFDGTYRHSEEFREGESSTEGLHRYAPHVADWRPGDPTWGDGKGKGLIGGLNYLAGKGVNSVYFLTLNINGDGKDVWPYVSHTDFERFDVSKLDQWERVFDHLDDALGMMLHIVLNETENETLLDGGDTGPQRRLYYRELIARFGHHRAVTWNLGEENGPNDWSEGGMSNAQQAAAAGWFAAHDPYDNYLVFHTHPDVSAASRLYGPLIGNANIDGLSLQLGDPYAANVATRFWLDTTRTAGASWMVTLDEVGPWWRGVDPDNRADINNQDSLRALTLWPHLLAGGAGVEWYFGAHSPHNDLGLEDWRSRDRVWTWTDHALDFFQTHLPFDEMESHDELVGDGHFAFAKPGQVYAVGLPFGGPATLDLSGAVGEFAVRWYNPRAGGELQTGSVTTVAGGGSVDPRYAAGCEWAGLGGFGAAGVIDAAPPLPPHSYPNLPELILNPIFVFGR